MTPVVAVLHHLDPPFTGHAGAVLRAAGVDAEGSRIGACAWGVQFHPEVDEGALDDWYRDWPEALVEAGVSETDARAADARHLPGQRVLAEARFGGFARVVRARGRARSASPGGT